MTNPDTPYLYHVSGFKSDGTRVDQKVKTEAERKALCQDMSIISCALLIPISLDAIQKAIDMDPAR